MACVSSLIVAVVASACGGSASDPGSSSQAGSGGSAGSGGKAPAAGAAGKAAEIPPAPCGDTACKGVTIPIQNFVIPGCCADEKTNQCGLDSSVLSAFGPTFTEACQPLDQPGTVDAQCPDSPEAPVQGTMITIQFKGCCRPNHTCGYMLDKVAGIVPLGLGCVDAEPFLDGGSVMDCAGDEAGGAAGAGQGGAAGDTQNTGGMPSAAGDSASGAAGR